MLAIKLAVPNVALIMTQEWVLIGNYGDLSGSSSPPVATESHIKQDRGKKQDLTDTSEGIGPRL